MERYAEGVPKICAVKLDKGIPQKLSKTTTKTLRKIERVGEYTGRDVPHITKASGKLTHRHSPSKKEHLATYNSARPSPRLSGHGRQKGSRGAN